MWSTKIPFSVSSENILLHQKDKYLCNGRCSFFSLCLAKIWRRQCHLRNVSLKLAVHKEYAYKMRPFLSSQQGLHTCQYRPLNSKRVFRLQSGRGGVGIIKDSEFFSPLLLAPRRLINSSSQFHRASLLRSSNFYMYMHVSVHGI